jgi:hypothetical protein
MLAGLVMVRQIVPYVERSAMLILDVFWEVTNATIFENPSGWTFSDWSDIGGSGSLAFCTEGRSADTERSSKIFQEDSESTR